MASDARPGQPDDGTLMRTLADPYAPFAAKTVACDLLVARHREVMCRTAAWELRLRNCTSLEALDVVHQVVAHLLASPAAGQFDPERELRPWLLQLVRYQARDLVRKERKYHSRIDPSPVPDHGASPQEQLMLQEELEGLMRCLNKEEEALCRRFYLDGHTAQEIAGEKGQTVTQVYRQLHRLRTRLRNQLPERRPEPRRREQGGNRAPP
jgi:RNA polymerase sigma factor (sigma-70 family)